MRPRLKTARPTAQLRQGRTDWYRIENNVGVGTASVYIYDEIGYWGVTAADFVAELSELTGVAAIDLHLNSPGGEVFEGLAIMNCLRSHPATVTTYVDGIAASIASVIAMAGERIIMGPHSQLMIHEGSGLCIGDAAEMRKMADLLDFQSDNIAGVYQARAGGTVEDWRAAMVAETWYTAEEAVRVGLADEVAQTSTTTPPTTGTPDMDNSWDLSIFLYAGREKAPAPTPVAAKAPEPEAALRSDIASSLDADVLAALGRLFKASAETVEEPTAEKPVEPEVAPAEEPGTPAEPAEPPEPAPEPDAVEPPGPPEEPDGDLPDEEPDTPPVPGSSHEQPQGGDPEPPAPVAPDPGPDDTWARLTAHLTKPTSDWAALTAHLTTSVVQRGDEPEEAP